MPAVLIDRVSALRNAPVLRAFSEGELFELSQHAILRRLHKEDSLVLQGESPGGLLVLLNGAARCFREAPDGREQVLRLDQPVSILNETHILDNRPHAACISASQDSAVLSLPLNEFRHLVQRNSRALLDALQLTTDRCYAAVELASSLSLLSVDQRIAGLILSEARRGRNRFCKDLRVELTLSNQEIGAMVGAVREVVSRSLAKLRKGGLVTCQGRIFTVPDEGLLERFVATGHISPARRTAVS